MSDYYVVDEKNKLLIFAGSSVLSTEFEYIVEKYKELQKVIEENIEKDLCPRLLDITIRDIEIIVRIARLVQEISWGNFRFMALDYAAYNDDVYLIGEYELRKYKDFKMVG